SSCPRREARACDRLQNRDDSRSGRPERIGKFSPPQQMMAASWSRTTRRRCLDISVSSCAHSTAAGVIVVPQHLPLGEVADDLILIWTATEAEEWTDRIVYLPI